MPQTLEDLATVVLLLAGGLALAWAVFGCLWIAEHIAYPLRDIDTGKPIGYFRPRRRRHRPY